MLKTMHYHAQQDVREIHPEYSRILSAAVINKSFRENLLKDPAHAIAKGFNGESFQLTDDEKKRLVSLKGLSLPEFALHISRL
jgi:hypothetical protein